MSLSLASTRGSVPIAFQLCLPQDWADDALATKPAIALAQMRLAINQSVLLADAACDDETVFRDGFRALDLLCPVSIRPATTVGTPGTAPLPPKPRVGRGARPTKLRRKPGNEPMSVKRQASRVKGEGNAYPISETARTLAAGKTMEKHEPRPTWLSIRSSAPCRWATCLTMARPRPVPPVSRERLRSTR